MENQEEFQFAIAQNYVKAKSLLLGTQLNDLKVREFALKIAGLVLPEGKSIEWATPEGWNHV